MGERVVFLARLLAVSIDDVLAGKFPPRGTSPHSGRGPHGKAIPVPGVSGDTGAQPAVPPSQGVASGQAPRTTMM